MPPQEMPDGQGRMIESAEVAHPQPPHHPLRTKVHRRRKGVHPRQSQPAEGIVQHGPRPQTSATNRHPISIQGVNDASKAARCSPVNPINRPSPRRSTAYSPRPDSAHSATIRSKKASDSARDSGCGKNSITLRSAFIAASGSLSSGSHSLSRNRSVSKRYTMSKSAKGTGTVFVPPRVPNYFTYNR